MNGKWILKHVGRRIYYRDIYNSIEEINTISRRVNLKKVSQHNYYFPYEINAKFLALLNIAEKNRENRNMSLTSKQYAYMWLKRKDGIYEEYGPYFGGPKKHSEDYIIELLQLLELLNILQLNADYTECWIYSTNCPCFGKNNRELKDHNPCMINLYFMMVKLEEDYNIKTYVGFSKFYGISGSFTKLLPNNPLKKNSFPINKKSTNQTINQKLKRTDILKDFSQEFFNLSNKHITELKDKKFKRKENKKKSKYSDLLQEIPKMFKNMVLHELTELFKCFEFSATFDQFYDKGWKKLANIRKKLATAFGINLSPHNQQEFFKNVEEKFLYWWDEIVKNASSTFLKENLNEYLKMCTLQLFLDDIPDPAHKNFIGCLDHTIEHFHPEIQHNNVKVMDKDLCYCHSSSLF